MKQSDLNEILKKHEQWLSDEEGGEFADLQGTDLRGTDMQGADLRGADMQGTDMQGTGLRGTDMQGTDLRSANLRSADMRGTNLRGANLDYSCFPLWCGSKDVILDRRLFLQLVAHICAVEVDDEECKKTQKYLMPLAKQSHVAKWLFAEWKERGE